MESKKRSKTMRVAGGMLAASLVMTCLISGTMAKYTSTASGSDTARVAKWSIKVNEQEIATNTSQGITFDLFETIGDDWDGLGDGAIVVNGVDGEKNIAPGRGGVFEVNVENESEVTAHIDVDLNESKTNNIPIVYSLDGTNYYTLDQLNNFGVVDGGLKDGVELKAGESQAFDIYWAWAFDDDAVYDLGLGSNPSSDNHDTDLGILAQTDGSEPKITIEANVIATQVD